MKKSIVTILAIATLASSFAGVAMAQSRGDNGGGRGGHGGRGGSDGAEYLRVITHRPRYEVVKVKGDVFCMVEKVRRYDAYGNRYFEHVRKCENRVVDVY
ncbi:hypothetical protein [Shinella sp.]|uniref:hypothetical protein n=1 Tax=unclassified Shinella TaxID=2643062 RepID=UPI0028A9343D|nr:hypothetical protein [Shinella sp.]